MLNMIRYAQEFLINYNTGNVGGNLSNEIKDLNVKLGNQLNKNNLRIKINYMLLVVIVVTLGLLQNNIDTLGAALKSIIIIFAFVGSAGLTVHNIFLRKANVILNEGKVEVEGIMKSLGLNPENLNEGGTSKEKEVGYDTNYDGTAKFTYSRGRKVNEANVVDVDYNVRDNN